MSLVQGRDSMPVVITFFGVIILGLAFGPMLWVSSVIKRHGEDRPDLPGTGAELARHLLDEAGLQSVRVEQTDKGDHYDPENRIVRLLPQHHDARSVAAVAIAAHEVSHAVQHARGEQSFQARLSLMKKLVWIEPAVTGVVILAPIVLMFVHAPALLLLNFATGVALLAIRVVAHLATLPVELDASFGKALPVLERGGYLKLADLPAARSVLRAAAWTYVAGALATLLQVWRWFRV
jgi:uncharacterized protein